MSGVALDALLILPQRSPCLLRFASLLFLSASVCRRRPWPTHPSAPQVPSASMGWQSSCTQTHTHTCTQTYGRAQRKPAKDGNTKKKVEGYVKTGEKVWSARGCSPSRPRRIQRRTPTHEAHTHTHLCHEGVVATLLPGKGRSSDNEERHLLGRRGAEKQSPRTQSHGLLMCKHTHTHTHSQEGSGDGCGRTQSSDIRMWKQDGDSAPYAAPLPSRGAECLRCETAAVNIPFLLLFASARRSCHGHECPLTRMRAQHGAKGCRPFSCCCCLK